MYGGFHWAVGTADETGRHIDTSRPSCFASSSAGASCWTRSPDKRHYRSHETVAEFPTHTFYL